MEVTEEKRGGYMELFEHAMIKMLRPRVELSVGDGFELHHPTLCPCVRQPDHGTTLFKPCAALSDQGLLESRRYKPWDSLE